MSLIGEIVFTDDTPQDTQGGTVVITAGDENKMQFTEKTVRGTSYTVMSQPNMDNALSRSYPTWTAPAIDDVSEWSVEILCNLPIPSAMGGLFNPPATLIRSASGNIDSFGATVTAPINKWFLFSLRHSAAGSDAYIDDTKVADITSLNWSAGACGIGAFSSTFIPNAEIAFIKVYDHVIDTPTSVSVPADDNNIDNLLGTLWKEEEDGGDQNIITALGDGDADVTFCGVACWGGLMAYLNNSDYTKISATISWDDYIIGTGHIGPCFSMLEIHDNHNRSTLRARIVCECSETTGIVTGVYAEVWNDSSVRQVHTLLTATAIPETEYYCEIEITEDDVNFTFGDNLLTVDRAFTDYDEYLIGFNLGMHFGPDWDLQLRNVEVLQHMTERGWNARKAFFKIFNQNIIGGY